MAVNYRITLPAILYDAAAPSMRAHLESLAHETVKNWRNAVFDQKGIWSEEKEAYMASIQSQVTSDFSAVVWSDYKYAEEIETGRPARDLKKMLQTSDKVRQGKNGRYLVIPIQRNTSGNTALARAMPKPVSSMASKYLTTSRVTGAGTRISATGATVAQKKYAWGTSLPAGLAPKLNPSHATDPYAGMVRMDNSTGKQKSSKYLTFRIMSERSTGWIIPAQPGRYIAKKVADEVGSG
jgi:hypothetical protein